MKKTAVMMTMIVMITLIMPSAMASGEVLIIDNSNIYDGMSRSYSSGYVPTVSGGIATVVLPLVYTGTEGIVGNVITVTPDLGSTSSSPFKFKNYEMNVSLANNTVSGGGFVSSYLVKLTLPLSSDRVNGVYPVIINTKFNATTSGEISQSFKVYVTITDGIDPNATPEPEKEPAPRPQPKIIMYSYKIKPTEVLAGEAFEIRLTLKNTEEYWHAKNIKLTYKGETSDILPNGDTNTIFIDEITDQEVTTLNLELKTRQDADPCPQKVLITIEYEDSNRTSYTVNEEIIVEIRQPLRLEFDEVNLPDKVNAGDSIPISMNVFNMGKSTLYNVLCTIDMKGVIPDGSAYLGNMESGTSGTAEIYAFFGTLDMTGEQSSSDNTQKYGLSHGTMTITYEDEYGESYTEVIELSTTIERPVFDNINEQSEQQEEEVEKASQWWVSVILAVGVIMIIFGLLNYKRKVRRLRRVYGNENI